MYNLALFHYSKNTINSHELKFCRIFVHLHLFRNKYYIATNTSFM